jgi:hypothetical protein
MTTTADQFTNGMDHLDYHSPFAANELTGDGRTEAAPAGFATYTSELTSPFSEAAGMSSELELEHQAVESLLADFEDEDFSEALEALAQEAAVRHAAVMQQMSSDTVVQEVAATEVQQWLETVAEAADARLAAIAEQYGERTVDSLTELELEQFGDAAVGESLSPFDAQEDFLKKLVRKVSGIARGVAKLAKKGLTAIGRFLPIGKLLDAVRRLVQPLLRRVLGRAIGRLPAPVQPAARALAKKLGLETAQESAEFDTRGEELAAEFDARLAAELLGEGAADGATRYEAELEQRSDPVANLDAGRNQLAEFFATAEHQADPTAAMEQFIPAVLPLIKLGVSIAGRDRVVKLVAGLVGKLIRPMVGGQLAPVLSRHIASSGLALIGLEAETGAEASRLGADALVSVAEDAVREVFEAEPEVLEHELLTAAVVQQAFNEAAARHVPADMLRGELLTEEGEDERGVWVMMPRRAAGRYRYRRYSRRVPLVISRPLARLVVLSGGETLEDRLLEAGVDSFPARAELEVYETLPGGEIGHVIGTELEGEGSGESAAQFEELDEASPLNAVLPRGVGHHNARSGSRHRRPVRRYMRILVQGRPLRRRSVLSMRLQADGAAPTLTVGVRLGEHQAHVMAEHLSRGQHVAVVRDFQRWVRGPLQAVIARRLRRVLGRHRITATDDVVLAAGGRIADAVAAAFAAQIVPAAARLAAAAKDPRSGVLLSFTLPYASREAILTAAPAAPRFDVSPGWQRHG